MHMHDDEMRKQELLLTARLLPNCSIILQAVSRLLDHVAPSYVTGDDVKSGFCVENAAKEGKCLLVSQAEAKFPR